MCFCLALVFVLQFLLVFGTQCDRTYTRLAAFWQKTSLLSILFPPSISVIANIMMKYNVTGTRTAETIIDSNYLQFHSKIFSFCVLVIVLIHKRENLPWLHCKRTTDVSLARIFTSLHLLHHHQHSHRPISKATNYHCLSVSSKQKAVTLAAIMLQACSQQLAAFWFSGT